MALGQLGDLLFGMRQLTEAITGSLEYAKRTEKASQSLGMTFEEARRTLGPTLKGIHGTMRDRMSVGLETVAAGLQGNNSGIALLINQQKLTGQAYKETAGFFASMQAAGIGNTASLNALAENTIRLGDQYTVSTESLVKVMKSLETNLVDMGLADMGPHVVGAIAELESMLGPNFEKHIKSVTGMIFDTSMDTYANLAKLQIPNIREQLSASRSQQEALQILIPGLLTASRSMSAFVDPSRGFFPLLGVMKEVFGRASTAIPVLANALTSGLRFRDDKITQWFKMVDTMWSDAWAPLQDALANKFYPWVLKFTEAASELLGTLSTKASNFIDEFPSAPEAGAIKTFLLETVDGFVSGFTRWHTQIEWFFTHKLPNAFDNAARAIENFVIDLPLHAQSFAFKFTDFMQRVSDIWGVPDFMPTRTEKIEEARERSQDRFRQHGMRSLDPLEQLAHVIPMWEEQLRASIGAETGNNQNIKQSQLALAHELRIAERYNEIMENDRQTLGRQLSDRLTERATRNPIASLMSLEAFTAQQGEQVTIGQRMIEWAEANEGNTANTAAGIETLNELRISVPS